MSKQSSKSTQNISKRQTKDKNTIIRGGAVVLLIAVSPILFYSYEYFPEDTKIWNGSFFTIETSFYSVNTYAWFLVSKVIPIYLLLFWFFTCKHWWHWIILVPIAMYTFQLWGIINQSRNLDEVEIYYLFFLMMFIIPAVYLIRAKLFSKIRGNDLREFEEELGKKRSICQVERGKD